MLREFSITALYPTFSIVWLHLPISLSIITALVIDMTRLEFSVIHWPQTSDSLVFQYEDYRYMSLHQFKFLFHREVLVTYGKLLAFCFKVLWLTKNTLLKSIGIVLPLDDPTAVSLPVFIKLVQHVWLRDLALSFSTGKNSLS